MSRIITIEREFGSGGRELGKRLAERLGIAYYDEEIIKAIAEKSGLAESYVQSIVERKITSYYPISFGNSFAMQAPAHDNYSKIFEATHCILSDMAAKSDCVIVGRCSDYILHDYYPLKLFICSNMESKLKRCREKAPAGENLTDKELERQIKRIDADRRKYYEAYTYMTWGAKGNYNLCVNTSGIEIKSIIPAMACFVNCWFNVHDDN